MTRIIVVTSGKGGVGKTSLVSNLATSLSQLGKNVLAVDCNLTTPNLGLHLGMHLAPNTLHNVLRGQSRIKNAIYPHPLGFKVMPASMSVEDLEGVDAGRLPELTLQLLGDYDYVLMDSAAGLGREALSSISAADEVLVITNPDMPSVSDALKTVKLAEAMKKKVDGVVLNRVKGKGHELTKEDVEEMIGYPVIAEIPDDKNVEKAIAAKNPVVAFEPGSPASVEFTRVAYFLSDFPFTPKYKPRLTLVQRLVRLISG